MAIGEFRSKVKTLLRQSRTDVGSEIETDVECDPIGEIPEEGLRQGILKSQESIGRPLSKMADITRILRKGGGEMDRADH